MARMVSCTCPQCHKEFEAEAGRQNRAERIGAPLYCGKICAGLARRLKNPLTDAEKKAAKAAYDRQYRQDHAEARKRQKAAYYQRTKDPVKEAARRQERMHLHVAYCQRPEYKAWKQQYDLRHRAQKDFGEFAEAALLLQDVEREIEAHATRYEIYQSNGTINKAQTRRRAL